MKKLLSILVAISLITIGSGNLIACDNNKFFNNKLSPEEIEKLKKENRKNIKGNILEWIAPQEEPFSNVDNKWYFVVWHSLFNNKWKINKFNNNSTLIKIDTVGHSLLKIDNDLHVGYGRSWKDWKNYQSYFIKSVYRFDGVGEPKTIKINENTGEIIDVIV